MAGSTFGNIFSITTWGESHGKGIGVVIDGCPAGLSLTEEDIQVYLNRRKPGQSRFTTPRKEDDTVEILSGVFDGRTTGTPISLMVRNTSSVPKITVRLHPTIVLDTQTIPTTANTDFVITPAADVLPGVRPLAVWPQVQSLQSFYRSLASLSLLIPAPSDRYRSTRAALISQRWNAMPSICPTQKQLNRRWLIWMPAVQKKIPAAVWWNVWSRAYLQVWAIPALIN